jgi:hypothetical protein
MLDAEVMSWAEPWDHTKTRQAFGRSLAPLEKPDISTEYTQMVLLDTLYIIYFYNFLAP